MPSSTLRVKPIRSIMRAAKPEIMVQLIRLIVLYEDLKLEIASFHLPPDERFDDVGRQYREMYFIRRAFATLWEMDSAFHKLNMLKEFKARKKGCDRGRLKEWDDAVKFFSKTNEFIDSQRNAYGGHVNDTVARFVLESIEDQDDSTGALEIKRFDDRTERYVFRFAVDFVSHAFFIDRGDGDSAEYLQKSWGTLAEAMSHAGHATQFLADEYLAPVFGWSRR